jgi:hypothetical protein
MQSIGTFDEDGIWIDEDKKSFKQFLAKNTGKKLVINVKLWRKNSSSVQRGYFHGVIIRRFSEFTGMTHDECYEFVMWKWCKVDKYINGKAYETRKSYNDLTTLEAEELHEQVRIWLTTEFGIYCPLPNEPNPTE